MNVEEYNEEITLKRGQVGHIAFVTKAIGLAASLEEALGELEDGASDRLSATMDTFEGPLEKLIVALYNDGANLMGKDDWYDDVDEVPYA